jgi:hypothetical protein
MHKRPSNILRRKPVFLFLLPLFFVLHGCLENYNYVPVSSALLLTGIYIGASVVFTFLFYLWYKSINKAALAAFLIMAFHFFFGGAHDSLKNIFSGSFITRYSFILPASGVLLLLAFIIIKKRKTKFSQTRYYLNSLFVILLIADAAQLAVKFIKNKKQATELPQGFTICSDCARPDIYFVILDEYTGTRGLRDNFQFDNSSFLQQLSSRGFHIVNDGYSNYNSTLYSIASILNMEYLQLTSKNIGTSEFIKCYEKIKNNKLKKFLEAHQYEFYNNSIFEFEGQPTLAMNNFLPSKTKLITSQTFLSRFNRDLRFNFVTRFKFKRDLKLVTYSHDMNNRRIFSSTVKVAGKTSNIPKFVYTHLMMPHFPYYYDSSGTEIPYEKLLAENWGDLKDYLGYLQYCNKKIIELVDNIFNLSNKRPIIIVMSDHGFRYFPDTVDKKYLFSTLNAIYLPTGKYDAFKDSSSAVNFFRTFLNGEFKQKLPYLKDSSILLHKMPPITVGN